MRDAKVGYHQSSYEVEPSGMVVMWVDTWRMSERRNESWAFQLGWAKRLKTFMRKSMTKLRNTRESNWSVKILDIFAYIIPISFERCVEIYLNTLWILHFSTYFIHFVINCVYWPTSLKFSYVMLNGSTIVCAITIP